MKGNIKQNMTGKAELFKIILTVVQSAHTTVLQLEYIQQLLVY